MSEQENISLKLDAEQVKKFEAEYIGKKVTLTAYESGSFHGAPKNVPDHLLWGDVGFGFTTILNVLEQH